MNNDKKKQELFVKYLKNKYGEENLTDEKIKELKDSGLLQKDYQDFEKALAKKAAHGTKLTYFKSLKHQCADDEELYYYKKGGSVDCGCKKKGGEVVKAGVGVTLAVKAFKAHRKRKAEEEKKKNTWGATSKIVGKDYERGQEDAGPESKILDNAVRDRKDNPENIIKKKEKKNNSNYYTSMAFEKGDKIVKKFKAKCGSKMKKHKLGGSLNGIPFYLGGTNKGGIKRGINGEYYTNPIPWDAGNGPGGDGPLVILEKNVTSNPNIITGEAPGVGKARGMIRAAKEASKISGKKITPVLRNALGKRSSTLGAITANDIDLSKVIVGQGIRKTTQPFKHDPYHPSNINRAANYYVKENNLETFIGPNGKMYVRTKDGKVRSFEAVGKEYIDNSGFGW